MRNITASYIPSKGFCNTGRLKQAQQTIYSGFWKLTKIKDVL